ncbi:sirtuin 2 [Chytriomyces cf. hyalinus JEL632]|nr:sirtuin 2 [Chytriomyces cf. hyalinus JEL632]
MLKTNKLRRIVVMTGAGISTSAGIPDFRSPSTGLYANLAKYNLPYPEAVFSINFFRKSPKPFFTLAKELYPGCFRPTVCHYFIRLLAEEGMLLRCYTQNIDTLERVAGIDESYLVEAHGSFASAKCVGKYRKPDPIVSTDVPSLQDETTTSDSDSDIFLEEADFKACGKEYSQDWVKGHVFDDKIPECERCQGIVKPNITFFGESLPKRFHAMTYSDFSQADALIVIGTSLQVQPFAGLINRVGAKVPRLLLNMELVGVDDESKTHGFDFEGDRHYRRDALFLGTADTGCETLADLMGLGDKLKDLVKREHAKFDCDEAADKEKSTPVRQESEEKPEVAAAEVVAAAVAVDEVGEILNELKL